MIDHTGVIVSDFPKSKAFYSAALGAIGIAVLKEFPASVTGNTDVAGYGAQEASAQGLSPEFWLARGEPGSIPVHIAFRVSSRALVDAFYNAAIGAAPPACARSIIQTTTARSFLIPMATTSKRFAASRREH